jgi:ankyrin repeat protein
VLLKHSPSDVDSVDRMLLLKPRCVAVRDRAGNTPLHVAATRPTSLDAVRHLCILYPEALRMRNRHGLTPLGLALQRTAACPDDVATFLLEQQQTTAATRHRGA